MMKIVDQKIGLYLCDSHLLPTYGQGLKLFMQIYRSEYGQLPLFSHIHGENSLHDNLTLLENIILPLSLPAQVSPYKFLQDWLDQRSHYRQLVKLIGDLKRYPHEVSKKEKWLATLIQAELLGKPVLFVEDSHHLGFDLFSEKLIKQFFQDEIVNKKLCFLITDRPGHWLDIATYTIGHNTMAYIKSVKQVA